MAHAFEPDMVVHARNPSPLEEEAGRSGVEGESAS